MPQFFLVSKDHYEQWKKEFQYYALKQAGTCFWFLFCFVLNTSASQLRVWVALVISLALYSGISYSDQSLINSTLFRIWIRV